MLYAYHLSGDITLGVHEYLMIILRKHVRTGMVEPGGRGAHATHPPRFWKIRKVQWQRQRTILLLATPDFHTFRHPFRSIKIIILKYIYRKKSFRCQ